MIIETFLDIFFIIPQTILNLLPTLDWTIPSYIADTLDLLAIPMSIFPPDMWALMLSSVIFWSGIQFTWAGIEWVYLKIPGVS